jgi:hypothetical protein
MGEIVEKIEKIAEILRDILILAGFLSYPLLKLDYLGILQFAQVWAFAGIFSGYVRFNEVVAPLINEIKDKILDYRR